MVSCEKRPSRDQPSAGNAAITSLPGTRSTAAEVLSPFLTELFSGKPPVKIMFWDGSVLGSDTRAGVISLRSPRALTRLVWSPGELGLARGFISGDIDLEGDLFATLRVLHDAVGDVRWFDTRTLGTGLWAAIRLGAIGSPPPRPTEEVRLVGPRHSRRRDAAAIVHHYDVGNEFFRLILGPAMTYSCARFERQDKTLERAQRSKHDLICRKLGLHESPNRRLLDVGCGWGSMALHAAAEYGAHVVAITLSPSQVEWAKRRVVEAGLEHRVEIRLQDYRDLHGETFDAISSIGMFEHVGAKRMSDYFGSLFALLAPKGRLLNHAISSPGDSKLHGRTFINRYVFPDGELIDIAKVIAAMEQAGFEVRDTESLREHYSETLHAWVERLEGSWTQAVELVGEPRARIWRLYMAASANGFDTGGLAVHQVLGVVMEKDGASGMPRTRSAETSSSTETIRRQRNLIW
jgi:cyclopropane-fatty-acyl-phospholipid synthase